MTEPPFDLAKAQRWFAIELNNLAWDLVEKPGRTPDETERMVHAAHASVHHWLQAGAPINHLRGQCLLATVYAAAGLSEPALRHADKCAALAVEIGEGQSTFDRATLHGCRSNALALAGRKDEAREQYAQALFAVASFEHPEEKEVFERLYRAP